MNVLITGASGLLGRYLLKWAPDKHDVWGTYHKNPEIQLTKDRAIQMDLNDNQSIYYAFNKSVPDIVIHCAAIGSVDYCENHKKEARKVNLDGTKTLLDAAREYHSKVVFLSTNAVFHGSRPPYGEGRRRNPLNCYGHLKVLAENAVRASDLAWLIVRPILLYGWPNRGGRGNWATRAIQACKNRTLTTVVDDTRTQPTYAGACATTIWALLDKGAKGTYHVSGGEDMSLYDFCLKIANAWGGDPEIFLPIRSDSLDIAPRPVNTCYQLDKLEGEGLRLVGVEEGLQEMKEEQLCMI